jgi:hypothetical protein
MPHAAIRFPRQTGCGRLGTLLLLLAVVGGAPAAEPTGESRANAPQGPKWISLFDGKKLGKWRAIEAYEFKYHGKILVADKSIRLEVGRPFTGVRWTGPFPKRGYEITLEAQRTGGSDFFCGLTFPVEEAGLTLIVGGWGGRVVGLSAIDGEPAAENETARNMQFKTNRWYRIRLRVEAAKIEVWIDKEKIVDLNTTGRELGVLWSCEPCLPLGIATWQTAGRVRNIRYRLLED